MRRLINFFVPGSILTVGALFFLNSPYLPQISRYQADFGAGVLTLLCALLAWRFDRSRILYILQSLLYVDIASRYVDGVHRESLLIVLVALLLANLFIVAVLKERGIHSLRGVLVISVPLIQSVLLFYGAKTTQAVSGLQIKTSFLSLPSPLSAVPETILLLIIMALATQLIRFLRYPTPLEGALFWMIVSVISSLFYPAGIETTLLFGASVLTLLISFIETSHTLAYKDELTGLPGRRALMEAFSKLGGRYSIAMVDIDFFKKFNDTHGHDVGDEVLKMVAQRLAKCTGGGRAFRYGGEEFCIVFSDKNSAESYKHLESVRGLIADQPFSIRKTSRPLKKPKKATKKPLKPNRVQVTVSIGLAERTAQHNQPETVMKQSDLALYRAKNEGRNRVCSEKRR